MEPEVRGQSLILPGITVRLDPVAGCLSGTNCLPARWYVQNCSRIAKSGSSLQWLAPPSFVIKAALQAC